MCEDYRNYVTTYFDRQICRHSNADLQELSGRCEVGRLYQADIQNVIVRNNSTLGDEAIQEKRSQKAVQENWEIKSINQLDCHGSQNDIEPRNDGKIDDLQPKFNDVSTYFDRQICLFSILVSD